MANEIKDGDVFVFRSGVRSGRIDIIHVLWRYAIINMNGVIMCVRAATVLDIVKARGAVLVDRAIEAGN
jgi:hypothetical protein